MKWIFRFVPSREVRDMQEVCEVEGRRGEKERRSG
jgi:hypothetical protein